MDLLKYEFLDAPKGSYNDKLKELVSLVRHYQSNVPIHEFQKAIPSLKIIERWLQNADETMGEYGGREYIEEIMQELSQEDSIKDSFLEEFERSSKDIFKSLLNSNFNIDDVKFEFRKSASTTWVQFSGYNGSTGEQQQIIKNIIQSVCSKYGVIFIEKLN